MNRARFSHVPDRQPLRTSLAEQLLRLGQSLRADETITATTMRLTRAAREQQGPRLRLEGGQR